MAKVKTPSRVLLLSTSSHDIDDAVLRLIRWRQYECLCLHSAWSSLCTSRAANAEVLSESGARWHQESRTAHHHIRTALVLNRITKKIISKKTLSVCAQVASQANKLKRRLDAGRKGLSRRWLLQPCYWSNGGASLFPKVLW